MATILIFAFFNALGAIFVVASQYIYFYATGYQLYGLTEGQRIGPIWLFPCMVLLFVTPIMSRIIYKRTRNPYIAGLINAMFIVMSAVPILLPFWAAVSLLQPHSDKT